MNLIKKIAIDIVLVAKQVFCRLFIRNNTPIFFRMFFCFFKEDALP